MQQGPDSAGGAGVFDGIFPGSGNASSRASGFSAVPLGIHALSTIEHDGGNQLIRVSESVYYGSSLILRRTWWGAASNESDEHQIGVDGARSEVFAARSKIEIFEVNIPGVECKISDGQIFAYSVVSGEGGARHEYTCKSSDPRGDIVVVSTASNQTRHIEGLSDPEVRYFNARVGQILTLADVAGVGDSAAYRLELIGPGEVSAPFSAPDARSLVRRYDLISPVLRL